jgi:hypothetical protein
MWPIETEQEARDALKRVPLAYYNELKAAILREGKPWAIALIAEFDGSCTGG